VAARTRMTLPPLLPVDDAFRRIVATIETGPVETVPLADAHRRVLARAPAARLRSPPADLSAMDGYALKATDAATVPARLTVVGEAPAGGSYDHALKPGEAVRIFTGGPLPQGADAIVIQEDTTRDGNVVTVKEAPTAGRHIRRAGLDFDLGATPIPVGRRLSPNDLALLAAMNIPWLDVHARPRIAVLATGNELVLPGELVDRNRIVASSGVALAAAIESWGGAATLLPLAPDDRDTIRAAIRGAASFDMLVTLGGASVGDHDLVQACLGDEGYSLDFWRIAMRPGKPLMFATAGERRALGLPGNPVSTMICALLFLKPAIEKRAGLEPTPLSTEPATLAVDLRANDNREDYVRATLGRDSSGRAMVTPHKVQDSSMLSVLAASNALLVRPAHDPARKAGDIVRVARLT